MLANSSTQAVGTPLIPALLSLLIATTVALAFAAYTGLRGRRKPHLVCVSISVLLFLLTVFAAELLGRAYIFQPAALAVHLWFAHAATVALLATAVTGMIRLQRAPPCAPTAARSLRSQSCCCSPSAPAASCCNPACREQQRAMRHRKRPQWTLPCAVIPRAELPTTTSIALPRHRCLWLRAPKQRANSAATNAPLRMATAL